MLTAHESVLQHNEVDESSQFVRFYRDGGKEPYDVQEEVVYRRKAWEGMGCPSEITVTIRPGNQLDPH